MSETNDANPGECGNCLTVVPRRHEIAYGQGGVQVSGAWCPACIRATAPGLMRRFFPDSEDDATDGY